MIVEHKNKIITLKKIIPTIGFLIFCLIPSTFNSAYAYCGDGITQDREQCDDGNFFSKDGCSSYCELEDIKAPEVSSVSIKQDEVAVDTNLKEIKVIFSEKVNPDSINKNNILFQQGERELKFSTLLKQDQKTLIIEIQQELYSEAPHAVKIRNVKDLAGNLLTGKAQDRFFIRSFTTAKAIDDDAPNTIARPSGGTFNYIQNIEIKAYLDEYTNSDEFLDEKAVIYYTLNDASISEKSNVYKEPLRINRPTTLRYFSIDEVGNRSPIKTEKYTFECPEYQNAKETINKYPECKIVKCNLNFILRGNTCVIDTTGGTKDIKDLAATAPSLPSDTPVYIRTKPAIYITQDHNGVIPRPIIFEDPIRGTVLEFEKGTKMTHSDGTPFSGYLLHPENLFIKDFPINFGYVFKSIFKFKALEKEEVYFDPPYKIIIPYTDTFAKNESSTVFSFNEEKELYSKYPENEYQVDLNEGKVIITSEKTGNFFIGQTGKNFNRSVFTDIENHWAKNFIEALYRKNIVQGKRKGIFSPDEYLTRAEFIKIALGAIEHELEPVTGLSESPFRDITNDMWYAPYLIDAKRKNLIKGYSDNSFRPNQRINRVEALKILFSAFEFPLDYRLEEKERKNNINSDQYLDLMEDEWYFKYVAFAIENEIMQGKEELGTGNQRRFTPSDRITRAEMAKITIKAIELKEKLESEK